MIKLMLGAPRWTRSKWEDALRFASARPLGESFHKASFHSHTSLQNMNMNMRIRSAMGYIHPRHYRYRHNAPDQNANEGYSRLPANQPNACVLAISFCQIIDSRGNKGTPSGTGISSETKHTGVHATRATLLRNEAQVIRHNERDHGMGSDTHLPQN